MHAMWWIWVPLFMLFFLGPFRRRRYWRYRQWRECPDGLESRPPRDSSRDDGEMRRREEQVELLESRVAELESASTSPSACWRSAANRRSPDQLPPRGSRE